MIMSPFGIAELHRLTKLTFSFERGIWLQKTVEKYHSLACRPSCAVKMEVFIILI